MLPSPATAAAAAHRRGRLPLRRRLRGAEMLALFAATQVVVVVTIMSQHRIASVDERRQASRDYLEGTRDALEYNTEGTIASFMVRSAECPPGEAALTLVTACGSDHYMHVVRLLRSVEESEMALSRECTRLAIYDLGMTQQQRHALAEGLAPLQGTAALVPFNFSAYPAHVGRRGPRATYAWKPLILAEVVAEHRRHAAGGGAASPGFFVVWLDVGDEVHSKLWRLREHLQREGFAAIESPAGTLADQCSPATLAYIAAHAQALGVPRLPPGFPTSIQGRPLLSGVLLGFDPQHRDVMSSLLSPWKECALVEDCIAPEGSSHQSHHFDVAVLSVLVHASESFHALPALLEELQVSAVTDSTMDSSEHEDCASGPGLTLITAATDRHFDELLHFVTSVNTHEGECVHLRIYDLNLRPEYRQHLEKRLRGENREVVTFDFGQYPSHYDHTNGWKVNLFKEATDDVLGKQPPSNVLYVDQRCELDGTLKGVRARLRRDSLLGVKEHVMIGRYTHKSTLDILAGNQRDYVAGMSSISSKVVGFNTASASAAAILSEWEKCSLDEACIAPKGTTRKTHRYEESVLSILLAQAIERQKLQVPDSTRVFNIDCPEDILERDILLCMNPEAATLTVLTVLYPSMPFLTMAADFARFLFSHEQNTARLVLVCVGVTEAEVEPLRAALSVVRANAVFKFFKLDELPPHYSPEKTNALKIHAINDILQEYGGAVLFLDARVLVTHALSHVRDVLDGSGILVLENSLGTIGALGDPSMLERLSVPQTMEAQAVLHPDVLGFHKDNRTVMASIFEPWLECAQDPSCIVPSSEVWSISGPQDMVMLSILTNKLQAIPTVNTNKLHLRMPQGKAGPGTGTNAPTALIRLNTTKLLRPLCTEDLRILGEKNLDLEDT